MKTISVLIMVLLSPSVVSATAFLILTDDDGVLSNIDEIGSIVDSMTPSPSYTIVTDNGYGTYSSDEAYLSGFNAVFWNAGGPDDGGRLTGTHEVEACNNYINGGGKMLITHFDLIGHPNDPIMAALINSPTYGDSPWSDEVEVKDTSHFITNGPYGSFDGIIYLNETDHDEFTPGSGAIEVIEIYDQPPYSKLLYTARGSGSVTGWNGNGRNDDFINVPECTAMLKNWVHVASGVTGIESKSLGEIKAVFKELKAD
jgi:hypothetical protein